MHSLSARLLVSVGVLLLVFFGATIVLLNAAFRDAGEQAQRNILDGHLMSLLAAAEPNAAGELEMPPDLPEERFASPGSGLYAALRDSRGNVVWRSRSSLGLGLPYPDPAVQGEQVYAIVTTPDGDELMALSLAVAWELADGALEPYTFSVAGSLDTFHAQIAVFRRQLFGWFTAVALVIVFAVSLVMRGILQPLRRIEREIGEIEEGRRHSLSEDLPSELRSVALNMNLLIGTERARAERYMHTLGNLAHSLKTPLAAIRSVLSEQPQTDLSGRIERQVQRMDDIVSYQLRKPARYAEGLGVAAVAIEEELERLAEALSKIYKDKEPRITIEVAEGAVFRGDSGDFLEIAGNLLDNACKWCRKEVAIGVRPVPGTGKGKGAGLELTVTDDGPGIPEAAAGRLLERGMRLDESEPGHGIGLAVVRDVATSYGGTIEVGRSPAGGARITVAIPRP